MQHLKCENTERLCINQFFSVFYNVDGTLINKGILPGDKPKFREEGDVCGGACLLSHDTDV